MRRETCATCAVNIVTKVRRLKVDERHVTPSTTSGFMFALQLMCHNCLQHLSGEQRGESQEKKYILNSYKTVTTNNQSLLGIIVWILLVGTKKVNK